MNPSTGQPYPNFTIPNISPFATALLNKYYPLPNLATTMGGVNYQTLVPIPSNTDGFDARIDQVINSKQQVYARFNRKNLTVNVVNPLLPNDVDTEHDRSFLVSHNYVISSRLLNEFRYGFTDTILSPNFAIEGAAALQGLGVQVGGDQGSTFRTIRRTRVFPALSFPMERTSLQLAETMSDPHNPRPSRLRTMSRTPRQAHDPCWRGCSLGAFCCA